MSAEVKVVTRAQLVALRTTYGLLNKAGMTVGTIGGDPVLGKRLIAERDALAERDHFVMVGCMFCDVQLPVEVKLDDTAFPSRGICSTCNDRIDQDVTAAARDLLSEIG